MARHFSTHCMLCWRLSRHCNRACPFCLSTSGPRVEHPEHDPFMIANRLVELGVEKISYSGGEPFEYPLIASLVRHVRVLGMIQLVTTNGDRLLTGIPEWIGVFEYVKLSFYGSRSSHDRLMGSGNYDQQLSLAKRLIADHGVIVGANYMLSAESLVDVGDFLDDVAVHGFNDVLFQTYIYNRRAHVDSRFGLRDTPQALAELRDTLSGRADRLPGGMKVHDYSRRDWFIVLDDSGRLTLPSSTVDQDFVMGRVTDETLQIAPEVRVSARTALETIWKRRHDTEAIIDLG
ncbi:radical SAM protein [Spongiactinospora sp. TRM90649]|uniref:radical SAM protein n=1 Tax=Spongiactinospora sp. TRM90649 TaxID=3031114 RepID=UPI0023F911D2|nr:radical SAM protein [Spongiactinospora sp. TRM90649]MDF5755671.1 radical SAM protein [Spongiactinospora sp. TRM90649]